MIEEGKLSVANLFSDRNTVSVVDRLVTLLVSVDNSSWKSIDIQTETEIETDQLLESYHLLIGQSTVAWHHI